MATASKVVASSLSTAFLRPYFLVGVAFFEDSLNLNVQEKMTSLKKKILYYHRISMDVMFYNRWLSQGFRMKWDRIPTENTRGLKVIQTNPKTLGELLTTGNARKTGKWILEIVRKNVLKLFTFTLSECNGQGRQGVAL